MKKLIKNTTLGLAGAGLLLAASQAMAQPFTITFTDTYGPAKTDWSHNFVLQKFNPAWGSLQAVYITATNTVNIDGTVQNTSTGPQSFTFKAGSTITVTLPGFLGSLQASPLATAQAFNLPAGVTAPYGPISASADANYTYTLPADMASFIGTGTMSLPGITQSTEIITGGGGNIVASLNTLSGATVWVTYTYIPEPGSLALLALGGVVMLLRKRR